MRRIVTRTVASWLALLLCAGCSGTAAPTAPPPGGTGRDTVAVERRDITSVVSLEGGVVASPAFRVPAPATGHVTYTGADTGIIAVLHGDTPHDVTLPTGARLQERLVRDGDAVAAGLPIARATYLGFAVSAPVPTSALYRFYDAIGPVRAQIEHGPGPFDCTLLGGIDTTDAGNAGRVATGADSSGEGGAVTCAVPTSLRLLSGSRALMAVTTGSAAGVLALPVEAVAGLAQQGTVTMDVGGGATEQRTVRLGITDGVVVQITDGLRAGDRVVTPAPELTSR